MTKTHGRVSPAVRIAPAGGPRTTVTVPRPPPTPGPSQRMGPCGGPPAISSAGLVTVQRCRHHVARGFHLLLFTAPDGVTFLPLPPQKAGEAPGRHPTRSRAARQGRAARVLRTVHPFLSPALWVRTSTGKEGKGFQMKGVRMNLQGSQRSLHHSVSLWNVALPVSLIEQRS